MDLMQMVKGAITQQVANKIGSAVGLPSGKSSSVIDTASAALLGSVLNKASSADGAKSMFDLAKNTDFSVLDKLGDLVGGSGAASDGFQKAGGNILDSVLGGNKASIIGTLAKALGLDSGMISKLLGMLAPVIMGVIGKQVMSQGLDAAGLGKLLGSQKSSLSNFLPNNLTKDLGFNNLLSGASGAVSDAGRAAASAAGSAGRAANDAGGGLVKVLLPLLLFGAVAFGLWKFLSKPAGDAVDAVKNTAAEVVDTAKEAGANVADSASGLFGGALDSLKGSLPDMDLSGLDLNAMGEVGPKLTSGFSDVASGLKGLTDSGATEDTARNLLKQIEGFTGTIDGFGLDKLEGPAKTVSSGLIGKFLGSINGLLESVPAPLRAIVEPAIKQMIDKLNPFKG